MTTLGERISTTVELLGRRGYAVSAQQLGQWLIGGTVEAAEIHQALGEVESLCCSGDLIHACDLPNQVITRCQQRQQQHHICTQHYWPQVERYVTKLTRWCPQVRCVALAGSMSSGGFVESDDVDFNLFVEDGTRYSTYLMANILALPFSFAHRHRPTDAHSQRLFLPKLMSINVIWSQSDTQPFVRQDGAMALELLLSNPIFGKDYYQQVLHCNTWLAAYFPQLFDAQVTGDSLTPTSQIPCWLEQGARWLTYRAWCYVMWTRRHNPEALARVAFVRQCQHPYALFQDK